MSFILNPYIHSSGLPIDYLVQYNKFNGNLTAEVGINGTGTNVGYTTGVQGQAVDLSSGNPSLVNFGDDDLFSFTDGNGNDIPFFMSFWIKTPETFGQYENVLSKQTSSSNKEYDFQIDQAGTFWYRLGTLSGSNYIRIISPTSTFIGNTLYHVVLSYEGNKLPSGLACYINKVSVETGSSQGTYTGMSNSSAPLRLGVLNANVFNFRGWIDEFAIFKGISATQKWVNKLYNLGQSGRPIL